MAHVQQLNVPWGPAFPGRAPRAKSRVMFLTSMYVADGWQVPSSVGPRVLGRHALLVTFRAGGEVRRSR